MLLPMMLFMMLLHLLILV